MRMKGVAAPMPWNDALALAEKIYQRAEAQPIPLSQKETLSLAVWLLKLAEENRSVVQSDDPHDQIPTANTRQVGGEHYGLSKFQHWDMVDLFQLDYFQGQITKYVMRWRKKNGLPDLQKAQHFLEKYIELESVKEGK